MWQRHQPIQGHICGGEATRACAGGFEIQTKHNKLDLASTHAQTEFWITLIAPGGRHRAHMGWPTVCFLFPCMLEFILVKEGKFSNLSGVYPPDCAVLLGGLQHSPWQRHGDLKLSYRTSVLELHHIWSHGCPLLCQAPGHYRCGINIRFLQAYPAAICCVSWDGEEFWTRSWSRWQGRMLSKPDRPKWTLRSLAGWSSTPTICPTVNCGQNGHFHERQCGIGGKTEGRQLDTGEKHVGKWG